MVDLERVDDQVVVVHILRKGLAHVDYDAKVRGNEEDSCHAVYQVHKDAQNDFELDRQDLEGGS